MDIFQILKKEHDQVKSLMNQMLSKKESKADDLMRQIHKELSVHMQGEEKLFYPMLEEDDSSREKALEGYEEHHVAKGVLKELQKMNHADERWMAKVSVLKEIVEHHVEEEEKELFKAAKGVFEKEEVKEIGKKYLEEKERMMSSMK
ncbi:MAG: hemerythrin domain-containing protein [Syntrophales bacterium]|jgi:hemerythrin superfamily protein|nr:hemerythrin domain-containing protein [Syntrophales bacterium]MDD5531528.1 hemerythrin domain-containing protein [Syntrophales bacterium]HPL62227.1 hemerythrin domain-containing protein [Syntrophales bacterium]